MAVDIVKNNFYTRKQIHENYGGSVQSYLPTVNGKVVCACLTKKLNPGVPNVILVGDRPIVKSTAEKLCEQNDVIPVFLKRKVNEWEYKGKYKVVSHSKSDKVLEKHRKKSGRPTISQVIYLKCVE